MSDDNAAATASSSAASSLFDLRTVIAILFAGYGIVLTIMGFFTSADDLAKAGGINLNLWVGIVMIVLAIVFVVWARTRPLVMEAPPEDDDRPPMHH